MQALKWKDKFIYFKKGLSLNRRGGSDLYSIVHPKLPIITVIQHVIFGVYSISV